MGGGWRAAALVVCAVSMGCAEPTRVRIVDQITPDGEYRTRDVEVQTLTDVDSVAGTVARFVGDAKLHTSLDFMPTDRGGSRDQVASDGKAVVARWVPEGDVAVPLDFDTLLMFSSYAHLEEAALHFEALGVPADATSEMPVYYTPKLLDEAGMSDNAAYIPAADAFMLLPNKYLQEIPLALNPGVLAHEYSHRIWYFVGWHAEMFARLADAPDEFVHSFNLSRGTDEGVADFFGAMVTGDPQFLLRSTSPGIADPRDMTQTRVVDAAWVGGTQPVAGGYYPYALGAVVSSTLWGVAELVGAERVERAVIAAQQQMWEQLATTLTFSLGDFETAVLENLDPADRPAACERFAESYQVIWTRFAAVCP